MFGALPGSPNENWNQAVAALVRELFPNTPETMVEDAVMLSTTAYMESTLKGLRYEIVVAMNQIVFGHSRATAEAVAVDLATRSGDPLCILGPGNGTCVLCGAPRAEYDCRYCADCRDVVSLFERSNVTLRMGGV